MRRATLESKASTALLARLRPRRPEIEQAILTRVLAISGVPRSGGPEYAEGLRAAVAAGVAYGLEGIECEQSFPPVPPVLLAQARLAARSGVSLDVVLRRYLAGHTLLDGFMVEEAGSEQLEPAALRRLLRSQAALADRLLAAVSDAYREEAERRPEGPERRRAELVERLLAGEPLDASGLAYELEGTHLGMVTAGPGAAQAVEKIARSRGCRLLAVRREEGTVWAWLGGRARLDPAELHASLTTTSTPETCLALGEPSDGPDGWRLTHRQARAALPIALRGPEPFVRYADVALLASVLQDDLLATSLRRLYLEPLEAERDGGALRETLRAYFACARNVSSAAAALGVSRPTVRNRLRTVQERIGSHPDTYAAELEAAIGLAHFGGFPVHLTAA